MFTDLTITDSSFGASLFTRLLVKPILWIVYNTQKQTMNLFFNRYTQIRSNIIFTHKTETHHTKVMFSHLNTLQR